MRRGQWLGPLLLPCAVLAAALGLAACGDDGDDATDTAVALPGTKERLLEEYSAQLEEIGTPPNVAQCYTDKFRALPDSFVEQLERASEGNLTPAILRLNQRFRDECVPPGTPTIDPDASSAQLDKALGFAKPGLRPALEQQGASSAQIACVIQGVEDLSDDDKVALMNSPSSARSLVARIARQCGGR